MTGMDLTTAARAASDVDPATGLRAVATLRRLTDELERQQVRRARIAGWSWQQIGDALGISRQAVHKKHRN
jgi:DNA-directed RNA polymerase specialized sigma24 family protein